MKKIFSIILLTVLLVSIVPAAFAANHDRYVRYNSNYYSNSHSAGNYQNSNYYSGNLNYPENHYYFGGNRDPVYNPYYYNPNANSNFQNPKPHGRIYNPGFLDVEDDYDSGYQRGYYRGYNDGEYYQRHGYESFFEYKARVEFEHDPNRKTTGYYYIDRKAVKITVSKVENEYDNGYQKGLLAGFNDGFHSLPYRGKNRHYFDSRTRYNKNVANFNAPYLTVGPGGINAYTSYEIPRGRMYFPDDSTFYNRYNFRFNRYDRSHDSSYYNVNNHNSYNQNYYRYNTYYAYNNPSYYNNRYPSYYKSSNYYEKPYGYSYR